MCGCWLTRSYGKSGSWWRLESWRRAKRKPEAGQTVAGGRSAAATSGTWSRTRRHPGGRAGRSANGAVLYQPGATPQVTAEEGKRRAESPRQPDRSSVEDDVAKIRRRRGDEAQTSPAYTERSEPPHVGSYEMDAAKRLGMWRPLLRLRASQRRFLRRAKGPFSY